MANEKTLTPQQRAQLFGASTRQHFQMLGEQSVTGGAQTISWRIPKSRILQGVRLLVTGKVKLTHASGTAYNLTNNKLAIYDVIRQIKLDYNNGFSPITLSGSELALLSMLYPRPEMIVPATDTSTNCTCPASLSASSTGTDNNFSFMIDCPLTLNYRDPVGLILAQNAETNIDIVVDINNPTQVVNNTTGYSATFSELKIQPQVTSFSIPADKRAFPDMSVLKIADSRNESFTAGQSYIKLPVGMIYRKLIFKFEDATGAPLPLSAITSNIEIILNTADTPYSISPAMLREVNKMQGGIEMPTGVYYFSFDFQGFNGYGGSRDNIDTERVSEAAVRFTTSSAGKLHIISEKISRLIAG